MPAHKARDMGWTPDGKFNTHINTIYSKVNKKISWILRSFKCRDMDFMRFVWRTYCLPVIDYCSQLWAPKEGPKMDKLERLQYFYTGLIPELRNLTYEERLKKLKMSSLQRRYDRYRIFYIWKIGHGLVPNCGINQITGPDTRNDTRRLLEKQHRDRIQ